MSERILIVDDEPSLQLTLTDTFTDEGYEVEVAAKVADAAALLERRLPDLVLCDLKLPDGEGLDIVRTVQRLDPQLPVLILTAFGTVSSAVEAMKSGAVEYLTKPFQEEHLLAVVSRHLEVRRLRRRVRELEGRAERPLGHAPAFEQALELAQAVAPTRNTVLLLGETGTGKDVLARYIHNCSPRRDRPFVAVNCSALPETLLESELFGHERGAFTGAVRQRRGRFEEANSGTLFLDEVVEMSDGVQVKLLRVLQERTFERLGSNRQIRTDVRIIAATRREIELEVAAGRFRDDLYYRLKVVPITLPPLRERPGDIAVLAHVFVCRVGDEMNRQFDLAPETIRCLENQAFPGNVRELENLIRRLAAVCPAPVVLPEHLPEEYRHGCAAVEVDTKRFLGSLAEMERTFEHRVLQAMLDRHKGHRGRIAEALGISRKNLWEKIKSHKLGE